HTEDRPLRRCSKLSPLTGTPQIEGFLLAHARSNAREPRVSVRKQCPAPVKRNGYSNEGRGALWTRWLAQARKQWPSPLIREICSDPGRGLPRSPVKARHPQYTLPQV
ncbi:hypothetical protein BaRGS_00029004, partial [Batillaria attramentaria]